MSFITSRLFGRYDWRAAGGCSWRGRQGLQLQAARKGAQPAFAVGDVVEAIFVDDGEWYPGKVVKDNRDGTFDVAWDDPDGGPEISACTANEMEKVVARTPLKDLIPGTKVVGTVKNVAPFGVFIDINAETDGLLHNTKIRIPEPKTGPYKVADEVEAVYPDSDEWYPAKVKRRKRDGTFEVTWDEPDGGPKHSIVQADEIRHAIPRQLQPGDQLELWISDIRRDRLALDMSPPPDLYPFLQLHPAEVLEGVVQKVLPNAAFIRIEPPEGGPPVDGFLHISQIRDRFIENISDELQEGQQVKVRILDVDLSQGRMSLTMKALPEY
eukprot:CAMPEP_0170610184 /NCGR_PEP_ID=MMETSP0224-20130122/22518_1 /TAXON_ID=285029 /ORGANISM="Togula jolla, Strain CCCM 725" /LENGTH=324 /DNA_ID=CAMNT_0010935531 /DNA_START=80 /DNA_END=1054 /DNA_ORIENTATION=+